MLCKSCGAPLEENAAVCSACGKAVEDIQQEAEVLTAPVVEEPVVEEPVTEEPVVEEPATEEPVVEEPAPPVVPAQPAKKGKHYQPRRKPHIALRVLLQLLSLVVCLVLCVSLVATVVLTDLNHIMSTGGIKQLINTILTPTSAPQRSMPVIDAPSVHLDEPEVPEDTAVPEENISGLIDWIYEKMKETAGGELKVTKGQLQSFMDESTISEYIAEKLAGYADDFINDTANTTITTDEVLQLLNENMPLIEKNFNIDLSMIQRQVLNASIKQIMEDTDISAVIREQVFSSVEDSINDSVSGTGITWEQLQPMLQVLCADKTMYTAIGVCAGLALLLCLLNFYNVPAGLTWSAVPCILIGAVLTVPLILLPTLSQMFGEQIPAVVMQVLNSFASVLLPIHSVVPVVGLALLVISIIWRIIRACIRRKRRLAAAA